MYTRNTDHDIMFRYDAYCIYYVGSVHWDVTTCWSVTYGVGATAVYTANNTQQEFTKVEIAYENRIWKIKELTTGYT